MAKPEPKTEPITMLFLGVRCHGTNAKATRVWVWRRITEEMNDGSPLPAANDSDKQYRERWYTKKSNICIGAQPGTVITIDQEVGETSIYPGSSRILGRWENEEDVVKWRSLHRAAEGELAHFQKAAKDVRQDLAVDALTPFREAYQGCRNRRQRSHLLAWIIEEITRPG